MNQVYEFYVKRCKELENAIKWFHAWDDYLVNFNTKLHYDRAKFYIRACDRKAIARKRLFSLVGRNNE